MRYDIISTDGDCGNICSIGYCADSNETRFGPAQRNQYIIHYVLSGSGFFNGSRVNKGQGFLIYPGMHEHYFPDSRNPWAFLWIIAETDIKCYFEKYSPDPKTNIFEFEITSALLHTRDFLTEHNNGFYPSSVLQEKFLHIFNSHTAPRSPLCGNTDLYFDYAVKYIQSNIFRPLRVGELTCVLGITQPYLYRIFMEKSGISPKAYIDRAKLGEAERLLKETNMSVTEIANSVGFADSLAFSRFFKNNLGTSPTQFRNGQGIF